MKRVLVFFLLTMIFPKIFAQTILTGTVKQENGEAIAGANAFLQGTYDGATSNEKGEFNFKTTKKGEFTLVVTLMSYKPILQKVILRGDTIRINVHLKEEINQLNEVVISAGTFEAGDKKRAVTITSLDMMTTAGAAGDAYGALQSLPGTITNGESGRLFVKGGDSEESQTYIDGSLVSIPYKSSAPNLATRGRFNPFMFKGMVFSTGGYSAEYGQALSSVLLLNTNDIPTEDQLDLSLLSVGAEIAGTKLWTDGAITGTFSYNNLQPYMSIAPQNLNWIHAPVTANSAISLRQKTGKTGLFKFYSNISKSSFTLLQEQLNLGGSPFDYNLTNDNFFTNASWNGKLNEKWSMNSAASFTNDRDNIEYGQSTIDKKTQGVFLKNVFSYPFTDRFILKFGGDFSLKSYGQNIKTPAETSSNHFLNRNLSGFTEVQFYATKNFVIRPGVRLEYSDYLKRSKVSPRLSAAYKINVNSQISVAYGWFFQNPADDYLIYTSQLDDERADHYTFSYQATIHERTLRAELYYKDYTSLVKYKEDVSAILSNFSNTGSGYARGLDLFWRDNKTIKNGDYWISYSYLDTKRNYKDFPETAIPTFASKHNVSVVYKHWLGNIRSYVGINLKYSSPRVYNDPNSTIFNGEKMTPYRSLDLSWSFLYRQNIIVYGAVTNVTGFKNEFGRQYADIPDKDGKYQSATILPGSKRFFVVACFITLTKKGKANQLDKIE